MAASRYNFAMNMPASPTPSAPRILLGVTAGIAAYKAAELVRQFVKAGAQVQVVMTEAAEHFVGKATFQALTGRPVRNSLWDEQAEAAMSHIELARWPDAIVIAPATADFLAHLAHGFADDLLTTLCLASDRPITVAPAMNRLMWANAATQANIATLKQRGVHLIGPGAGEQACGEIGEGRMSEPEDIARTVLASLAPRASANQPLRGVKAVVTAGPTREPLDPVRFITNRSSGKQGYAVAQALAELGADVTLISGPVHLDTPAGVQRVLVETAQEMHDAALGALASADILIGTAAVADYRPAEQAAEKIKKSGETLTLKLARNPDIIADARRKYPHKFIVGFAAETEKLVEHAQDKLRRKKLDLIAANWVGNGRAFDRDDNTLHVFWNGGERTLGPAGKTEVARGLAHVIAERHLAKSTA
jgi:phosphopantothenoylcysteine decarboxylase/phosphopantothenate--cysteine ligase